jgi:MFS family permease
LTKQHKKALKNTTIYRDLRCREAKAAAIFLSMKNPEAQLEKNESYQRNITKVCFHSFITGVRPFLPIFFLYLKDTGFSYLQIGSLFSVMAITGLMGEIPAGSFADKFGAKYSMMLSSFLFSAKISGRELKVSKYLSKKWASFYYGLCAGALLCPLFLKFNTSYTFYFTAILYFLSIFILATITQPPLDKETASSIHHITTPSEYFSFLKRGVVFLMAHKTIKYLLFFSVMFGSCAMIYFQYLQVMLKGTGLPKEQFGFYYAGFTCLCAFSSQHGHHLARKLGEKKMIFLLLTLTLIPLIGAGFLSGSELVLFPILVMQVQAGISVPVMNSFLNQHIESHNRTTLNSIKSFIGGLMMALLSSTIGKSADAFGHPNALFILAGLLIALSLFPAIKITTKMTRQVAI